MLAAQYWHNTFTTVIFLFIALDIKKKDVTGPMRLSERCFFMFEALLKNKIKVNSSAFYINNGN